MRVRRIVATAGVLAALATACTSTAPTAVQGQQSQGGGRVVAQLAAPPELTASMLPGEASYIGASVDGSLIGFLMADGYVRWYKTH